MGKYILLITFAGMLGTTLLMRQSQRTAVDTSEDQGDRQGIVIARQIARSAFNDGISEVKRNFSSIADGTREGPYEGGTFEVTYDVFTNPSGNRVVEITADGEYRNATYRITGKVEQKTVVSSLFNAITVKDQMTFSVNGPGCSSGACISGKDDAGNGDRHGISLWASNNASQNESDVCNEFAGKVEGKGSGCDVVSRGKERDKKVVKQMEKLKAEIESLPSNKKTVCEAGGGPGGGPPGGGPPGGGPPGGGPPGGGPPGGGPPGGGPPGGGPPGGPALALHAGGPVGGPSLGGARTRTSSMSSAPSAGPPGNCKLVNPQSSQGIYYVKGDLTINGTAHWNGIVYVAEGGSITINGGGGAKNINGALLMEGNTNFHVNGGGVGNLAKYNSAEILKLVGTLPSVGTKTLTVSDRAGALLSQGD